MSGHPYKYGRGMAIAQLMRDMRRPALQEIVKKNKEWYDYLVKRRDESGLDYNVLGPHGPETVYLHGEDLYVSYSDTIDWVPKLSKLTKFGREAHYIRADKPEVEGEPYVQWGTQVIEPIKGWPTEEEIATEIAASAEREKNWNGSLSANDLSALSRLIG